MINYCDRERRRMKKFQVAAPKRAERARIGKVCKSYRIPGSSGAEDAEGAVVATPLIRQSGGLCIARVARGNRPFAAPLPVLPFSSFVSVTPYKHLLLSPFLTFPQQ